MPSVLDDTRDFLRKQLAELADSQATPEQIEASIKRANATVNVANAIVATVKVEVDAVRAFGETGFVPAALDSPTTIDGKPVLRALPGGKA